MSSLRVALFAPTLEAGGAERVMVTLANRLCARGIDVHLVVQRATGAYLPMVDARVKIVDLKATRLAASLLPLLRYLRRECPAAMLSTPADANIIATLAWRLSLLPGRLVVREAITASVDDVANSNWSRRLVGFLRGKVYRLAHCVVAPSAGVASDLVAKVGLPASRVTVVPNPLDLERIQQLAEQPVPDFGTPEGAQIVVSVGRLFAQKDFAMLIRAFATVSRTRNAVLLLLGEGDERARLEELAVALGVGDRVIMPGFVENPFAFIKSASVFVLSSRYEGLPNALLEALAVGVPVVATDCPSGPCEILEGGAWGALVPVGDSSEMSAAIIRALDGQLRRLPVETLNTRYGPDQVAQRYLEVLCPEQFPVIARERGDES